MLTLAALQFLLSVLLLTAEVALHICNRMAGSAAVLSYQHWHLFQFTTGVRVSNTSWTPITPRANPATTGNWTEQIIQPKGEKLENDREYWR